MVEGVRGDGEGRWWREGGEMVDGGKGREGRW